MAVGLALSLVSTGCKYRPVGMTHIPPRGTQRGPGENDNTSPIPSDPRQPNVDPNAPRPNEGIPQPPPGHVGWTRNESALAAHTVHFAYDSSVVRAGDKANVAAVAEYLKSNASAAVEVDGHCDERGTDEYNRSLGERRALAIREALVADGVDAARVDTVSFGRDRLLDLGKTDAAHAKNRRGEFILLTPP